MSEAERIKQAFETGMADWRRASDLSDARLELKLAINRQQGAYWSGMYGCFFAIFQMAQICISILQSQPTGVIVFHVIVWVASLLFILHAALKLRVAKAVVDEKQKMLDELNAQEEFLKL